LKTCKMGLRRYIEKTKGALLTPVEVKPIYILLAGAAMVTAIALINYDVVKLRKEIEMTERVKARKYEHKLENSLEWTLPPTPEKNKNKLIV